MTFCEKLEDYCLKHSQKELSEKSNIPASTLSGYMDGMEPNAERKELLSEIIGYDEKDNEEFKQEVEYVPLDEASKRLGMGIQNLQNALKAGVFDFGIGFHGNGNRFYYYIFRKKFESFIKES